MKRSMFGGSAVAVVTPMDEYGNLDLDVMGRLLDWLLEGKTNAIVVNGITGESTTLDSNERMEVIGLVIRHVSGRVPVIAGTGSNCTEHTVKLSREAEKPEADALLQVTSYCNKASQEGLVRHSTQVGNHVEIPMIFYNVPSRMGVTIQPETYQILPEHSNIRGAKKAGGNMPMVAETATLCGDGFDIYLGNNDQIIPVMALGSKGVISVLTNTMPRQTHGIRRLFLEGKLGESRKIQLYLLDIMEALFWDVNPIPIKVTLPTMRMRTDNYRLPPALMKAGGKAKLGAVMKQYR